MSAVNFKIILNYFFVIKLQLFVICRTSSSHFYCPFYRVSQGCPATSTREARVIQRRYRASRPAALISLLALPFRCNGARTLLAALLPFLNDLTAHFTHTHTPCAPLLAAVSLSRRHYDQRALRHRPRQHASDRKSMPSTEEHNRDDSRCRRHHEQLVMHGVHRCQPVQQD